MASKGCLIFEGGELHLFVERKKLSEKENRDLTRGTGKKLRRGPLIRKVNCD